ncbi:MAG: DNA replication and repair protein RecF [Candidatus Hepatoplasma vulgare]|nr:MAG: DNA replication and repair protein RecF [Candidatus Hepatoplasma sp.]
MITKISAFNFRNYDELNFNFDKNIVFFYGNQNVGKTSILETIYFSIFEKSFRTNLAKDLIKKNKEHTLITIEYNNDSEKNNVITTNIKESFFQHLFNQRSLNSKDFKNYVFPIFINKSILSNFEKSKEKRWEILNELISIDKKIYLPLIKDFEKSFTSYKNSILIKDYHDSLKMSITEKIVNLEYEILKLRKDFFKKINNYFIENLSLYLNTKLLIDYKTFFKEKNDLLRGLNEKKIITILDDEIVLKNENNEYVHISSKKERVFLNLLLLISIVEYVSKEYNQEFPLLLDDILSEIDEKNYFLFFKILKDKNINVFITNSFRGKISFESLEDVQVIRF